MFDLKLFLIIILNSFQEVGITNLQKNTILHSYCIVFAATMKVCYLVPNWLLLSNFIDKLYLRKGELMQFEVTRLMIWNTVKLLLIWLSESFSWTFCFKLLQMTQQCFDHGCYFMLVHYLFCFIQILLDSNFSLQNYIKTVLRIIFAKYYLSLSRPNNLAISENVLYDLEITALDQLLEVFYVQQFL